MTAPARSSFGRAYQRGVGLLETMVGILIGMLVVIVVYNILSVAEAYKRNAIGASDAQVTGLLTQFLAGRDAGNGGAGITGSVDDLINCTKNEGGALLSGLPVTSLDVAARPISLLITPGAGTASDSFISLVSGATHVMWPVDLQLPFPGPGQPIVVQSPNGFTVPPPSGAFPYWVVVMTNDPASALNRNKCKVLRVTAATAPDAQGKVTLTQDATTATTISYPPTPSRLLNLGRTGQTTRIQYDVDDVNHVLRTTDLLVTPGAPLVANPIAQNLVLMKAQYGIDLTVPPDGVVDCWTAADAANTCGDGKDYSPASVRTFNIADLRRILAVRIGVVVRSDEPDLKYLTNPTDPVVQKEAAALRSATPRPAVVLFNCSTNTNAACQSRFVAPAAPGVPLGSPNCAPAVICDLWRYRTYETVIPLRNAIYNATMP